MFPISFLAGLACFITGKGVCKENFLKKITTYFNTIGYSQTKLYSAER